MLNAATLYTIRRLKTGTTITTEPDAMWVIDGDGHPGPLWDGLSVHVDGSSVYVEHMVTPGGKTPAGFKPVVTDDRGTWGWQKLSDTGMKIKTAVAAAIKNHHGLPVSGFYELIGPGIARNPHKLTKHVLKAHGIDADDADAFPQPFPRNYYALADWMATHDQYLGVAWFHRADPYSTVLMRKKDFK